MPILILNDKILMTSQNKALSYTGEYPDGDEMEFGDSSENQSQS